MRARRVWCHTSGAWGGDGQGIGFWHWFIPEAGRDDYLADWFGVPAFNYAAWWAAPLIMISFAMFIQYFRGELWRRVRNRWRRGGRQLGLLENAPSPLFGFTGVAVLAFYLLVQISREKAPIWLQWTLLSIGVLGTAIFVFRQVRHFQTQGRQDPNLALSPLVFLGLPVAALLLEGLFLEITGLILVGLVSLLLVALFTLWPYEEALRRFVLRVIDLDRFLRLAYFGFPALTVLLGAAFVALDRRPGAVETDFPSCTLELSTGIALCLSKWDIGGLLTAALAFQIFAYVFNDVRDLEVDRSQAKRQKDPLVRGTIEREVALAIALVQVPAAFLVAFLLNGGRHRDFAAALPSYAVLAGGFALMFVYNVFGKRCKVPPLTDALQALAWGSLALFGALVVDPHHESKNWILVWTLFAFGAGFILLISGIDGGLRDLANDLAHGCRTTAIWLGARVDASGAAVSNRRIQAYAFVVQTAMFVLPVVALSSAVDPNDPLLEGTSVELTSWEKRLVGVVLGLSLLFCHYVLARVVRNREPKRDRYISGHPLVLMQTPLLAFAPFLAGFTAFFVLVVVFYGPLLSNREILRRILRFTHPRIAESI